MERRAESSREVQKSIVQVKESLQYMVVLAYVYFMHIAGISASYNVI